jgi:hypothetical protein
MLDLVFQTKPVVFHRIIDDVFLLPTLDQVWQLSLARAQIAQVLPVQVLQTLYER